MKEFTKEMYKKLIAAHNNTRGTKNYNQYLMETEAKINGRWRFAGWHIPCRKGVIKTFKGKTYIITEDAYGYLVRFEVTEDIKMVLEI